MIVCLIAILKCGCVYLPTDKIYPAERISYVFSDCSPKFVFNCSNEDINYLVTETNSRVINVDGISSTELSDDYYCDNSSTHDDPFYCIYTSGTTGKPKGVLDPQRTLMNVILNQYEKGTDIFAVDTAITTSIGFDVFLQKVFSTLLAGGTMHIISDELKKDCDSFCTYIAQKNIRNIFCTPSYFDVLTSDKSNGHKALSTLKNVFLAGEKFFLNKLCIDHASDHSVTFHNDYGPTETHVVTSKIMTSNNGNVFNAKIPDSDLDIEITDFDSRHLKREKRITCYTLKNWIYFNFIISARDKDDIKRKLSDYFDTKR